MFHDLVPDLAGALIEVSPCEPENRPSEPDQHVLPASVIDEPVDIGVERPTVHLECDLEFRQCDVQHRNQFAVVPYREIRDPSRDAGATQDSMQDPLRLRCSAVAALGQDRAERDVPGAARICGEAGR